jgi:thiamine transport system ATP-binding protein
VWRHPVAAETALFLGYARVLHGEPAARVARAAGLSVVPALALRRSALAVSPSGSLAGTVLSSRITPEQVRVEVDADGIGPVDAVAPLDAHPAVGVRVALAADPTRMAAMTHAAPAGPVAGQP